MSSEPVSSEPTSTEPSAAQQPVDVPEPAERTASPARPEGVVLSVQDVGKCYRRRRGPLRALGDRLRGRSQQEAGHWAVRNVSFELERGQSFAIVGRNGSGKSTLLQMISGNLDLTEGRIEIDGRVGALLELGSGFNPEFTGRENARLQALLMGLSDAEIAAVMPTIEEFADIGAFFDEPARTYSSGMFVRVAFAVQVQTEPDVLIIDEALAVGDSLFQKRCYRKMEDLQSRGVTLLFVSHDQDTVRSLTRRALLLDHGTPRLLGSSGDVVLAYRKLLHEAERESQEQALEAITAAVAAKPEPDATETTTPAAATPAVAETGSMDERLEFGDGYAQLVSITLHDANGAPAKVFETGTPMTIRIRFRVERPCDHLNVGVRIRNRQGVKVYSWGTLNQDMSIRAGVTEGELFWERNFEPGQEEQVELAFDCRLAPDLYEVQASVSWEGTPDYRNQRMLHWRDEAAFFQVTMDYDTHFFGGLFDLHMNASW